MNTNEENTEYVYVKFTPENWEKAKGCIEQYIKYRKRLKDYRDKQRTTDKEKRSTGKRIIYDEVNYEIINSPLEN